MFYLLYVYFLVLLFIITQLYFYIVFTFYIIFGHNIRITEAKHGAERLMVRDPAKPKNCNENNKVSKLIKIKILIDINLYLSVY